MATKILQTITRGDRTIASRVLSEKLGEEVWVIYDEEIWNAMKDSRPKYSADEMADVRDMSIEELASFNRVRKIFPYSEIVDVKKNRTNKKPNRGGA
jgi:glycerol dehydrogenase-like iron-containing ADH family enzyme